MRTDLQRALSRVLSHAPAAERTALQLKWALERHYGRSGTPDEIDFNDLTSSDVQSMLDRLLAYVDSEPVPQPRVLYILGASEDDRVVPHIVTMMTRQRPGGVGDKLVQAGLFNLGRFRGAFDDSALRDLRREQWSEETRDDLDRWFGD